MTVTKSHIPPSLESTQLLDGALPHSPLVAFDQWFSLAEHQKLPLPEACAVATVAVDGRPSIRMVLYKGRVAEDFLFFTNYQSRKGRELESNASLAMLFHWPTQERQIRIEGQARRADRLLNQSYFTSRPRGSQIGAWASAQSAGLASREILEKKFAEMDRKFANQEVPCPENWGGYLIRAQSIEFWQGKESRLHDRFVYARLGENWRIERIQP